jgi:hypothetical protein
MTAGEPALSGLLVKQEFVNGGSLGLRYTGEGRSRGRVRHAVPVAELSREITFCVWK